MIKYYIGQFFRVVSYLMLPGFLINIFRAFFLNKTLVVGYQNILKLVDVFSWKTLAFSYFEISIVLYPVSLAIYLLIRYRIYKRHFNDAYREQLNNNRRRYRNRKSEREIWDDTHWDKP